VGTPRTWRSSCASLERDPEIAGRAVSWVGLRFFGGVMFVFSAALLLDLCFGEKCSRDRVSASAV